MPTLQLGQIKDSHEKGRGAWPPLQLTAAPDVCDACPREANAYPGLRPGTGERRPSQQVESSFNGGGGDTKGRAHWRREARPHCPACARGLSLDVHPPPLARERVSPQGSGRESSSTPTPGLCLSQAPGWRGTAGVRGGGWSQQKAETSGLPHKKKRSIKSPGALAPPTPIPGTKKCKTLSQKGGLGGALSLRLRGPCPSPALPRTPRPARSGPGPRGPHRWPEAGPGLGRAVSCRCPVGTTPPTPTPSSGLPPPTACPCPSL